MIEGVLNTIEENKMFNKGDKVIVAVSGGPDSMCLLHILYVLQKKLGITLYVAHVNHCLRGEEGNKDEEYVKTVCEKLSIQFKSLRIDVNRIAKEKSISCESAGREVRYKFFEEFKNQLKAEKIAIAHNANDQAETVLMRIMRGAGLQGLTGINPVRDNVFVRPLICTTRGEIEKYCYNNNLHPRIDKTNLETIYSRNKIRLELIPYIQKNFNKDIITVLNRLSDIIKIDNDYLDYISQEKFKKYCEVRVEQVIIFKGAFLEQKAILVRIIRLSLEAVSGDLKDIEKVHIFNIIDIQGCSTGKDIMLPHNILVSSDYGNIIVRKNVKKVIENYEVQYTLKLGCNNITDIKSKIYISLIDLKEYTYYKKDRFIQYFDYNKIKGNIILRNRRKGDKFTPLGMVGSKKLKSLFIDLKISKNKRDKIPLVCFGNEIGWVVGYRISELFKVDKNTKDILAIKFESEEL
ncbi:tRNA lysidine(34) synthetase TilS [Clostridium sp. WILCCON 0269]|uniref:tRNA(Ile)-lysidine synthase n=1 Tax=Candidatus Clostridium eludens TaxID=3381663 RepID=A0ABW8SHU4_9CLOT